MALYFLPFIIGAAVGSFLNVLIDRLPRRGNYSADSSTTKEAGQCPAATKGKNVAAPHGAPKEECALKGATPRNEESPAARRESILFGRSYCESCRTPLRWFDLIPLFSFLFLRGRCRYCGEKIPLRIPVVELLTGIGFVVLFCFTADSRGLASPAGGLVADSRGWDFWLHYSFYCTLFSSFLVLFFADLEYGVLPDSVTIPAVVVTILWRFFPPFFDTKYKILDTRYWLMNLKQYGIPAISLAGFFMILILVTRGRGMGLGDVKLGFLMGLVLGWPGTLVAAFLAFLFGGIVSAILLVSGKREFGQRVPFGPFLIAGTAVSALYGSVIWEWYVGML